MRYGMIYLVVKDFQRSLDFYKKVLDMQKTPHTKTTKER